ncbi:hypothetical protein CRE_27238 [Caenorhabditis remanei]|uniref:Uncharacterized protein n=1 Tax=Caenorhabditis remanei TaxID=31234 RepID=E3LP83_CAERE|nr:hypothetical protein CRE_27238 [Caenorhabditis remanei]
MSSYTFSVLVSIVLLVTVIINTVSSAPVPTDRQKMNTFPNLDNDPRDVFLPFREVPERLIDQNAEMDDSSDLVSESDIFYQFQRSGFLAEVVDARKRGGF